VAIELTDELIQLQRETVAAREAATAGGYGTEAWRLWRGAAERLQAAVTAHAEATEQNRYEVERELKKRVLHPESGS
jgi:hypothetical protein